MDVLLALIPIGFGGLLAAAGIFLFCLGWLTRGFDRQIAAQGVDTQAEITAHRTQMAKKGTARVYTLTTTYRVPAATGDGLPQTFTQESEVSAADYERLNPGDQVKVRYLPAAPKEMILSGGIRDETAPRFMQLGIILLALAAGFILLGVAVWPRLPQ